MSQPEGSPARSEPSGVLPPALTSPTPTPIDTAAPETTINSGPSGLTNDASPSFDFSSEPGASFQCQLDSTQAADWQSCSSPKSYSSLAQGPHTFEVRATDQAGNTDQTPASRGFTTQTPTTPDVNGQWYTPTSIWNTPIPANPAIAANNSNLIDAWADTTRCRDVCLHTQYDYTPAIWVADNTTPMVMVQIDTPSCAAFTAQVPIPANAVPDPSSEGHMAIMQVNTGVEYDFYKAQAPNQPPKSHHCPTIDGWTAAKVVTTNWQTGNGSLRGSVRGSGTPEGAGTIRPRDTQMPVGSTWDHALALSYPNTCSHSMAWCPYVAPATDSDGTCTDQTKCVPEGARFQLDPSIDCSTWPSLQYEWQKQMCRTFQVYGGIVVDTDEGGPTIYDQWRGSLGSYKWPWLQDGTTLLPNDLLSHFRVLAW